MRKKRDVVLGVDIGGTNIKVGQVSGNKINQTAFNGNYIEKSFQGY